MLIRFDPHTRQKCFVTLPRVYAASVSSPRTHRNWSVCTDARVRNALPCQRRHFEQWQLKIGPSEPSIS